MDFSLNEAQVAIAGLARKILLERASHAVVRQIEDGPDRFHAKLWSDLAATGLLATAIPEAYGGGGHGLVEVCTLLEEIGAAVAPVPAYETLVLGALPIATFGSPALKERWLPKVAAGEAILTAALVEPGAREPSSPTARARRDGDRWVLDGQKTCVPAAHLAARVLVPARTPEGGIGVFLVDPKGAGVSLEPQETTHRHLEAHMTLDRAPADGALGDPGRGEVVLASIVDGAIAGLCAMEAGVVGRALQITAQYTATRQQFERPIATFQAVAQRAADAYIDVEAVRLTACQAAWRLAEGLPAAEALAIAKITAAEAGHRVVAAAQHLHGGMGFDLDYPIHRHYLWSRHIELTLGGASQHLARLGDLLAAS